MRPKFGLVLSAGGARAAYQVGVIRFISKHCPQFVPTIYCGMSAGSINASYLAQGGPFGELGENLYKLWMGLQFNDIFKTNFRSIFGISTKLFNDIFFSKVSKRLLFRSVLDASPLAMTISKHMRFGKLFKSMAAGITDGLSITATNYNTGLTTIFYDSNSPIQPWSGPFRKVIRTSFRLRHIMASCSIPILFEPVRIGDAFFGDGALKYNQPFSPALHMGATHILAIGINEENPAPPPAVKSLKPTMGFMAGVVLDSIFMDSLEPDYKNIFRRNEFAKTTPSLEHIEAHLIRPSINPAAIAENYFGELPYNLRQMIKSAAMDPHDAAELLSYLLFSPGYIKAMTELGEKDAEGHIEALEKICATFD